MWYMCLQCTLVALSPWPDTPSPLATPPPRFVKVRMIGLVSTAMGMLGALFLCGGGTLAAAVITWGKLAEGRAPFFKFKKTNHRAQPHAEHI